MRSLKVINKKIANLTAGGISLMGRYSFRGLRLLRAINIFSVWSLPGNLPGALSRTGKLVLTRHYLDFSLRR